LIVEKKKEKRADQTRYDEIQEQKTKLFKEEVLLESKLSP